MYLPKCWLINARTLVGVPGCGSKSKHGPGLHYALPNPGPGPQPESDARSRWNLREVWRKHTLHTLACPLREGEVCGRDLYYCVRTVRLWQTVFSKNSCIYVLDSKCSSIMSISRVQIYSTPLETWEGFVTASVSRMWWKGHHTVNFRGWVDKGNMAPTWVSVLRCSPWKPSHCVEWMPSLHGDGVGRYSSQCSQGLRSQPTASINHQAREWQKRSQAPSCQSSYPWIFHLRPRTPWNGGKLSLCSHLNSWPAESVGINT